MNKPTVYDTTISVALLTGGGDPHYAFGLTCALVSQGATVELIGSDDFESSEVQSMPGVKLFNLRGSMKPDASFIAKLWRVLKYYGKLIWYAATSRPRVFHILWNNRFEAFDRTILMLYYRLLGKKIALTAHNVNTARRDGCDSWWNRLTLKCQYRICNQLFVHTERMKSELVDEFGVRSDRVTIIPYGLNNAVPITSLTSEDAKDRLQIQKDERTILFFGRIAPAKGLDCLLSALFQLRKSGSKHRLILAGRPDRCEEYWQSLQTQIAAFDSDETLVRANFIPDEDIEIYFKAADVLVLPYRHIYQSGVLFLGQSFGLPVLASDVGSLKEEIVEGETGFIFAPENPSNLASCIEDYFNSDLYRSLSLNRARIQQQAQEKHSWTTVGAITMIVYSNLVHHIAKPPAQTKAPAGSRKADISL